MTNKENSTPDEVTRNWERDLRRGLLKLMVLLLIRLKTEKAHGYGIIKQIEGTKIHLKAGTVYPLLKRMEAEGLITSLLAEDLESPGMPRRIYTITTSGEEAIESMIQTYYLYHQSIQKWYREI